MWFLLTPPPSYYSRWYINFKELSFSLTITTLFYAFPSLAFSPLPPIPVPSFSHISKFNMPASIPSLLRVLSFSSSQPGNHLHQPKINQIISPASQSLPNRRYQGVKQQTSLLLSNSIPPLSQTSHFSRVTPPPLDVFFSFYSTPIRLSRLNLHCQLSS